MNAELHYGGNKYGIVGGEERAAEIIAEVRRTIAAGGGTITVEINGGGRVNCVIGAAIPFAILLASPMGLH